MASYSTDHAFSQFGSAVPDWHPYHSPLTAPPSKPFLTPSLLAFCGGRELEGQLWCCVSSVQQQLRHWCVTSTVPATNTQHSAARAAMGKVNSFLARPNKDRSIKKGRDQCCSAGTYFYFKIYLLQTHKLVERNPSPSISAFKLDTLGEIYTFLHTDA